MKELVLFLAMIPLLAPARLAHGSRTDRWTLAGATALRPDQLAGKR